jgi:NADH-quinone oxidoreductase subunit N
VVDGFARFMKVLTLVASAAALLLSFDDLRRTHSLKFEYPVLVLLATAGMLMMISANDLISLYLGLELQSLSLYVLAAIRRDDVRSSEAGLKYFVLGALSSGMLLYGASLIYGFTGSTSFPVIAKAAAVPGAGQSLGLIVGLVFLMVGLAFKISAVPFHMWTPDVYEGAPTPVAAFFSAAPKVAAMALLMRVTLEGFAGIKAQWQQIVTALAIASMVLGAFAAIGQSNIKRLLAYSAIGNIGYALIGLAAGTPEGARGVVIYLVIYVAMTLGAFACVLAMRRGQTATEEIDELSGLAQNNLMLATLLAILLFSLAGIPPLAGFFAKFYVFLAAVREGLWPLAIIGVLASVVGAYYYVRIVKIMFFDQPRERFASIQPKAGLVMAVAGLSVLLYVIYPAPLVEAAGAAVKGLF